MSEFSAETRTVAEVCVIVTPVGKFFMDAVFCSRKKEADGVTDMAGQDVHP